MLQHSGQTSQGELKSFLLGSAATLVCQDVVVLFWLSCIILLFLFLFFKEFMVIAFDRFFAQSIGLPVKKMDFLFTSLMVLAIVIGIRAVGVVLMSAMLITPATTARFWTAEISYIILIAMFSSLANSFVCYTIPSMPTGPWIVLTMSLIAYFSFLISWYCRISKKNG